MNISGKPIAKSFVMDITIGAETPMPDFITDSDAHVVEAFVGVMGKAASEYVARFSCDAYVLRLTAVPVDFNHDTGSDKT